MTTKTRLVVFDVDGTLVDSQGLIVASMTDAFEAVGLAAPARSQILSIVGLSLPVAIARLVASTVSRANIDQMVQAYKDSFVTHRAAHDSAKSSPLFPGTRAMLERLHATPDVILGVATGKSRRGLDLLLEAYALGSLFETQQVADFHPSKPHPAMLHAALDETGVAADHAVMIGDTTFDMDMARAADMPFIGVSWGYHPAEHLKHATTILNDFGGLDAALTDIWES